jgi:hypothetical protein
MVHLLKGFLIDELDVLLCWGYFMKCNRWTEGNL